MKWHGRQHCHLVAEAVENHEQTRQARASQSYLKNKRQDKSSWKLSPAALGDVAVSCFSLTPAIEEQCTSSVSAQLLLLTSSSRGGEQESEHGLLQSRSHMLWPKRQRAASSLDTDPEILAERGEVRLCHYQNSPSSFFFLSKIFSFGLSSSHL